MPNDKKILDLIAEYFRNEQLRSMIFMNEDLGLDAFGMPASKKAILVSLDEQDIRLEIERELAELFGPTGSNTALATALIVRLRQLGLDLPTARRIIREGGQECRPVIAPASEIVSAVAAAGYGAGEVHIRKVSVLDAVAVDPVPVNPVPVNGEVKIEVAGQGFAPTAQVGFGRDTTVLPAMTFGTGEVARRADPDVHQYLTVNATFIQSGTWHVAVSDNGDWVWAPCTFEVV